MNIEMLNEFSGKWDYFGSYSVHGVDISVGDCYIELDKYIRKLKMLDDEVEGLFYICKHGPEGRPHVHSVIKSKLPLRKVEKAWSGSVQNKKVKVFDESKAMKLWLYIKLQSVGKSISVHDLMGV
jgi:hypothetical protein